MRTRSSSNLIVESSTTPKRRNRRRSKQRVEPSSLEEIYVVTMADQRTMAELLQAPTEGYGDAIVITAILAENFELKHGLLNLVTSKQFYGFEKEDPHAHIRWFNKIISTIKYKEMPNSSIKLMLFTFSIEEAARIWLKKDPPRSILTWENLVSKFINQLFPPSKTTNLRNEITNFQQKFEETFKLHPLDTFYNALTQTDQDSLNDAAGGNLLTKTPRDALTIIENKSKVRSSRNKPVVSKVSTNAPSSSTPHFPEIAALADAVKAMLLQKSSPPASVRAVKEICVTCGGPHPYHQYLATDGNVFLEYQDNIQGYVSAAAVNYNQGNTGYRPQSVANQIRPPGFAQPNLQNNQTCNIKKELRDDMSQQNQELKNMMTSFLQMNTASSSGSGSLPSNTVTNPRADLKAITTLSGISYDGPPIPPPLSPLPKVVKREIEKLREKDDDLALKFVEIFRELDFELSFENALLHMPKFASMFKSLLNNKEKLFDLAKTPVNENCSAVNLKKLPEKLGDPGKFLIPRDFPEIVECLALANLGASINLMPLSIWKKLSLPELTPTQMILELADRSTSPSVDDEAITFKVGQTSRYSYNDAESVNRIDVIDVSCEEYAQEVLGFLDSSTSGNPTPSLDPILSTSFLSLSLLLREGDIRLLEKLLNDDPSSPLPPKELHFEEIKTIKSSINDPPELELKD
ncbi:reverse transcriptase domain-containing protein [Tanacetum coccineum]